MLLSDHDPDIGCIGYLAARTRPDDRTGFFAVAGVQQIDAAWGSVADVAVQGRPRCDAGAYGPFGFHRWNAAAQVCNCGATTPPDPTMGHHLLTMKNIAWVQVVADALPHGYILYFEVDDPAVEQQALTMRHSDCAPTLQELLRLMVEWSTAHTVFGSLELVAATCHAMLQAWNVPPEVLAWVQQAVPPQKVERFLRGDTAARSRTPGCPALPPVVDEWLEALIMRSAPLGHYRLPQG